MNLSHHKHDLFLAALERLGEQEWTVATAWEHAQALGMPKPYCYQTLSRLEKEDFLVRIARGRYVTMTEYRRRQAAKEVSYDQA